MSSIRKEVQDFAALGPLPTEDAKPEIVVAFQDSFERISGPLSDAEAALLLHSFGRDDCFGAAWSLLHLIETAPGAGAIEDKPADSDNQWLKMLWSRSHP